MAYPGLYLDRSHATLGLTYDAIKARTSAGWVMEDGTVVRNENYLGILSTGSGDDTLIIDSVIFNKPHNEDGSNQWYWFAGAGSDRLVADFSSSSQTITTWYVQSHDYIDFQYHDFVVRYGTYSEDWGLAGGIEAVTLTGGSANDLLFGLKGDDGLDGGPGNDELDASAGSDTLSGGAGNDLLNGGTGADLLIGGAGNDTYWYGSGDYIVEEADGGIDTVMSAVTTYALRATLENVTLTGRAINADGNRLNNIMTGTELDNLLQGGQGNDTVDGRSGADTINGGAGADSLSGGAGNDIFLFRSLADSPPGGRDTITDMGTGDRIDLSLIDADTATADDQGFHLVGAFGQHAAEIVLSFSPANNRTALAVDVNGDGVADLVVLITGQHTNPTGWML